MDAYTARGLRLALGVGVGLGLIAAALVLTVFPASRGDRTLVTVMVRLDTSVTDIAQMLRDAGAIDSADAFVTRATERGAADQVKIGPHTVVVGDSVDDILTKLTQAK